MRVPAFLLAASLLAAPVSGATRDSSAVVGLREEARALATLFRTPAAREFLSATAGLPEVRARAVYHDSARTRWWSEREAQALPDSARALLVRRALDERFYWNTRYGSPLAYALPLEVLAENRVGKLAGRRVLDFGYGTIGHLRLLAALGAEPHGVDVDPMLRALYADDRPAEISLHHGSWPGDPALAAEIGEGYDVFLSKNTLKNGYLHPAEKVDPRMLVQLGVTDSAYVAALARLVRSGGLVLIYNLSPAPAPPGKPYLPWADGRCPFPRQTWEAAGFEVLAFDRDDSERARALGRALGWNQGERPMDLENDLFASYSLFRRRARR